MGDRTRQPEDRSAADERDLAESAPQSSVGLLHRLWADPRTRAIVLKRLRARKARLAQEAAAKSGEAGEEKKSAEGGGEEAAAEAAAAQLEKQKKKGEDKEQEEQREADHDRLGGHDEVGAEVEHAHDEGEEFKRVGKTSVGAKSDGRDLQVSVGHEAGTEEDEGEYAQTTGVEGAIGTKNGQLAAEGKLSQKTADEHGAHETSQSLAVEDGHLKLGADSTREHNREVTVVDESGKEQKVTKTSSKTVGGELEVSGDGVGGALSFGTKSESGASSRTKVGGQIGKDGASGTLAKTWTSAGGKSVSVSIHGAVEVHTSDPQQIDENHFLVSYERIVSAGAGGGGGAHGIGASVGASEQSVQNGTRVFETLKEALDFKQHAAEYLADAAAPDTVEGAMTMAVGESRGSGSEDGRSLGVSGAVEGASLSWSHHSESGNGISVRRVSKTEFDVTYTRDRSDGGGLGEQGLGVKLSRTDESSQARSITVRFDLSTAEGKDGFEAFCDDPFPRDGKTSVRGGKVVSRVNENGQWSNDDVGLAGLDNDNIRRGTSEKTSYDEQGNKAEEYSGGEKHDSDPTALGRVFGAKDEHSSVNITSRQLNDKEKGYEIVGTVSGESGAYNRGKMQHLFGRDEKWDESKVRASGEWTMTAEVDKKTIHELEKYKGRFKGLSDDDKMRELGRWVAEGDADTVNKIESWGDQLSWDIELKGDPNFPGRAGREAIEQRTKDYGQKLAAADADCQAIAGQLQDEIDRLSARRAAVADTSRYTDLPDGLRQKQLELIDRERAELDSLHHRALIQAMRSTANERELDIATRANSSKGYDQMSPDQKPMAQLRDQIALKDYAMAGYQKECARAAPAIRAAADGHQKHLENAGARALFDRANKAYAEATALDAQQRQSYKELDQVRMTLLYASTARAFMAGERLVSKIDECATVAASAQEKYYEAAKALVPITDMQVLLGDFWDDVRAMMEPDDYALAPDDDGGGGD